MGTVMMHAVASLDGFIADPQDEVGRLFDWYFNGGVPLMGDGPMKISQTSARYVKPMWESIGVTLIGRRLFDLTNGWDASPPAGDHMVVVSHRPRPEGWHPGASCHFAGDVGTAIAKAHELAGDRVIAVAAGDVGGQALALGLVDYVAIDIAPVVFGTGKRYFGSLEGQQLLGDPDVVVQGDRVLHLRYPVLKSSAMTAVSLGSI